MKYRPEIDGLRALAVLPVIFFHAGFGAFSGGYVGVDVFFVVSGFLITKILMTDLEQGRFSILTFYERRARRILPALFFVILACLPFAYLWMTPTQLEDFAQSIVATVLFGSNVLFWLQGDYFGPDLALNPLLHTWTLAVEEQFYVVFPVFLFLAWRFGRSPTLWIIIAAAIASLLLAEWSWRNAPRANFYLAPTRAWELLAGSICAFITVKPPRLLGESLSLLGLGLIAAAVFTFDETLPFPSLYTVAPVLGAVLIVLFATDNTLAGRTLAFRGLVGVGLVSYSAYLWHQPLFAFARLYSLEEPSRPLMAALSAAALLLAWISWRFVEQPFRTGGGSILKTRTGVFTASAIAGGLLLAVGLAGHFGKGFDQRLSDDARYYAQTAQDRAERDDGCFFSETTALPEHPVEACRAPAAEGGVSVMMIGDSHSLSLSEAVADRLRALDIGLYEVSYSGCVPLPGFKRYERFPNAQNHLCSAFNADAYDFARRARIDTVVLTARFPLYLRGERFDNLEGGVEPGASLYVDLDGPGGDPDDAGGRKQRVLSAFEDAVLALSEDFNVVLVHPIPEAGWHVPRRAMRYAQLGREVDITTSLEAYERRNREVLALFRSLAEQRTTIHLAPVEDALCDARTGRCLNARDGEVLYYDDDHLSNTGAERAAGVVVEAILAARET